MEITRLNNSDIAGFVELVTIFKELFENSAPFPNEKYLANLLVNPDFFVVVAKQDNEVVGGLTVFILHVYYNEKPVAYIYDVGIKPSHRGKGIGRSLIDFLGNYCRQHGFLEAYVEAEADDLEAVSFYRKTKFSYETRAIHFSYTF